MLDINLLRKDLASAVARLEARKSPQAFLNVDAFTALEAERKSIQTRTEELQAKRNALSKQIGQLKAKGPSGQAEVDAVMAQTADIKGELETSAARLEHIQTELQTMLLLVPNLPHDSVPRGADEHGNVVVRTWGTPQAMGFDIKDHVDLGEPLGLDFEMGVKLTGARFTVMKGSLARLHRALAQFMLDVQTQEHGYTECYTPYIVNGDTLRGTGQLPKFEGDLFAAKKGGQEGEAQPDNTALYLIPTSEVTLTNFVRDVVVAEADLPLKLTAHTPCFRSEAGSAGRDTRGMLRQHQFAKVELVSIVKPEESDAEHERMTRCAERVLTELGLVWRRIILCAGDTGFGAARTYDLEVWLPGQGAWREISSCSNCRDFQARRMGARYRAKDAKGTNFLHTLNGSGVAVGRALIAVLETHQQEDGSIAIPEVLRPYMGGMARLTG